MFRDKRFVIIEISSFIFALVAGVCFLQNSLSLPLLYDAQQYFELGQYIYRRGLNHYGEIMAQVQRTYGYPFWISLFLHLSERIAVSPRGLLLSGQLALYLCSIVYLRRQIRRWSPRMARLIFIGLCANFFVIAMMADVLTESLLLSLVIIAAGVILSLLRAIYSHSSLLNIGVRAFIIGLIIMYMATIRPSSTAILPAFIAAFMWCAYRFHTIYTDKWYLGVLLGAFLCGGALSLSPQLWANHIAFGEVFVMPGKVILANLGEWGKSQFKYATYISGPPQIFYYNPFYVNAHAGNAWYLWYFHNPVAGLKTFGLHIFGILDQDLFFTYAPTLTPWWRIPVGLMNHLMIGMAIWGLIFWGSNIFKRTTLDKRNAELEKLGLFSVVLFLAGLFALQGFCIAEMRYGLPALLLSFPLAFFACIECYSYKRNFLIVTTVLLYVFSAMLLSEWTRMQAPRIGANPEKILTYAWYAAFLILFVILHSIACYRVLCKLCNVRLK